MNTLTNAWNQSIPGVYRRSPLNTGRTCRNTQVMQAGTYPQPAAILDRNMTTLLARALGLAYDYEYPHSLSETIGKFAEFARENTLYLSPSEDRAMYGLQTPQALEDSAELVAKWLPRLVNTIATPRIECQRFIVLADEVFNHYLPDLIQACIQCDDAKNEGMEILRAFFFDLCKYPLRTLRNFADLEHAVQRWIEGMRPYFVWAAKQGAIQADGVPFKGTDAVRRFEVFLKKMLATVEPILRWPLDPAQNWQEFDGILRFGAYYLLNAAAIDSFPVVMDSDQRRQFAYKARRNYWTNFNITLIRLLHEQKDYPEPLITHLDITQVPSYLRPLRQAQLAAEAEANRVYKERVAAHKKEHQV